LLSRTRIKRKLQTSKKRQIPKKKKNRTNGVPDFPSESCRSKNKKEMNLLRSLKKNAGRGGKKVKIPQKISTRGPNRRFFNTSRNTGTIQTTPVTGCRSEGESPPKNKTRTRKEGVKKEKGFEKT